MTRYNLFLSLSLEKTIIPLRREKEKEEEEKKKGRKGKIKKRFQLFEFLQEKKKKRKEIDLENIYIRWKDVIIRERREEMGNE